MTQPDNIQLNDLSPLLRELVEEIGLPHTLELVRLRGGARFVVPVAAHPDHSMTKAIGPDSAAKVTARWGGKPVYIPKAAHALRQLRNREICAKYDHGVGVPELVREYNLTDRQIYTILSSTVTNTPPPVAQPSLF